MWKKIVVVFVCILFLVISVIPGVNGANIRNANFLYNPPDYLDQNQTLYNMNLGCAFGCFMAQSFIPRYPTLTRVELLLDRMGELETNLTISIRSSLDGNDLTSVSIKANKVPKYDFYDPIPVWIELDFPDIQVTQNDILQRYYIVWQPGSDFGYNSSSLFWYQSTDNPFKKGEAWSYTRDSSRWYSNDDIDFCFKTYGSGEPVNTPPDKPSIDGRIIGKVGDSYNYIFRSYDNEEDYIAKYIVDWGDGNELIITGPFRSGLQISANHTWAIKGYYIIKAKAIDVYGGESDYAIFSIGMPKGKKTIEITDSKVQINNDKQFVFLSGKCNKYSGDGTWLHIGPIWWINGTFSFNLYKNILFIADSKIQYIKNSACVTFTNFRGYAPGFLLVLKVLIPGSYVRVLGICDSYNISEL